MAIPIRHEVPQIFGTLGAFFEGANERERLKEVQRQERQAERDQLTATAIMAGGALLGGGIGLAAGGGIGAAGAGTAALTGLQLGAGAGGIAGGLFQGGSAGAQGIQQGVGNIGQGLGGISQREQQQLARQQGNEDRETFARLQAELQRGNQLEAIRATGGEVSAQITQRQTNRFAEQMQSMFGIPASSIPAAKQALEDRFQATIPEHELAQILIEKNVQRTNNARTSLLRQTLQEEAAAEGMMVIPSPKTQNKLNALREERNNILSNPASYQLPISSGVDGAPIGAGMALSNLRPSARQALDLANTQIESTPVEMIRVPRPPPRTIDEREKAGLVRFAKDGLSAASIDDKGTLTFPKVPVGAGFGDDFEPPGPITRMEPGVGKIQYDRKTGKWLAFEPASNPQMKEFHEAQSEFRKHQLSLLDSVQDSFDVVTNQTPEALARIRKTNGLAPREGPITFDETMQIVGNRMRALGITPPTPPQIPGSDQFEGTPFATPPPATGQPAPAPGSLNNPDRAQAQRAFLDQSARIVAAVNAGPGPIGSTRQMADAKQLIIEAFNAGITPAEINRNPALREQFGLLALISRGDSIK